MSEMKILAHEDNTDFIGCDIDLVWGAKNSEINVIKGIKRF